MKTKISNNQFNLNTKKMKNLKITTLALVALLALSSCSKDDTPPVNEEELITTVTVVFTPQGGGTSITLQYKDLDGDGPNAPDITVPTLAANTTYTGTVTILNETENPPGDITSEVEAEGDEHQLFFQAPSAVGTFVYNDADANGKPIGLKFTLTTKNAATGDLVVTLRHLPNKSAPGVADGEITNAGGVTDFAVTYPVTVK
jgi:hypothetical protein